MRPRRSALGHPSISSNQLPTSCGQSGAGATAHRIPTSILRAAHQPLPPTAKHTRGRANENRRAPRRRGGGGGDAGAREERHIRRSETQSRNSE